MQEITSLPGQEDFMVVAQPSPAHRELAKVSCDVKVTDGVLPYCPVYVKVNPDGSRVFTAYITGIINDVNDYLDLIDTLFSAHENDKYYIYIDSPGGMIAAGSVIASAIDASAAEVFTIARGLCASAAALIHSAAKPGHNLVTEMAVMMYHMSLHSDQGNSVQIEQRAHDQVRYVNEILLSKALADGHLTAEEFERIQHGEEIFVDGAEYEAKLKAHQNTTEENLA